MWRGCTVLLTTLAGGSALAAPDGAALYKQHCAICHQDNAAGAAGLAPTLLGEQWKKLGAKRSYLLTVTAKGLSGPIKVDGKPFVGAMPGQEATLEDDEIAAIATHLRTLQGGDGPAYSADEAAAVRKAAGDPARTRALRRAILGE